MTCRLEHSGLSPRPVRISAPPEILSGGTGDCGVRFVDGKQRERTKEEIKPEEIKKAGKIAA